MMGAFLDLLHKKIKCRQNLQRLPIRAANGGLTVASFFVTTPIYYVNAKPHLGHAYTTIVGDAFSRFHKCIGVDSLFLTGTDEHGDKIVQAAEKAGLDTQAFTDGISAQFQQLWVDMHICNDKFVRTSSAQHKDSVQNFLQKVYDAGDIYFGEFGGHYCYGCERFYTEKELEDGVCPQHLTKPEFISEKNYFFKMSKYLPWLKQYIQDNPTFIRPERYRNEVLAMLEGAVLDDLCISRPKSRLTWGIELPFDTDYVCYVWFDALLSYLSPLGMPDGDEFKKFWPGQHLVAKDILKPHAIFWPTMLKSAGLPLYKHLNVHGYWLVRDTKMSKSLGNVIDPLQMGQQFGLDAFRYFLLREMNFGSDASFSEEALITRINADLSNSFGNLFSRVLSMNAKYFNSTVPTPLAEFEADAAIRSMGTEAMQNFVQLFSQARFSQAIDSLWEFVRSLNKYVDTEAPWALAKQGNMERLTAVMYTLIESLHKVALFIWPVMPKTSATLLTQLGTTATEHTPPCTNLNEEALNWGTFKTNTSIAETSNVFPRVENTKTQNKEKQDKIKNITSDSKTKQDKTKDMQNQDNAAKKQENAELQSQPTSPLSFDDFKKVEIRVGTISNAEKHPNADKLLCLEINLGEEKPRQILSGLAEFFAPADIINKQVCVVTNLAPRKIRGLISHGMVLTAEKDGKLELLGVHGEVPNGSLVS